MFVYKVTNLINGKIYVGKTTRSSCGIRWSQHRDDAKCGRGKTYFAAAMRKHGVKNFKFEVIDRAGSLEELNRKEIEWIAKLDSANREKGYNLTNGGDRPTHGEGSRTRRKGYKRSPEVVAKIKAAVQASEKWQSYRTPEWRAALSAKWKGVPVSPERAAAMKAKPPGLGTKRTEEQRQRMRNGINASWTPELRARVSQLQKESRARNPRPGHPLSEENKQKLIAATKARWAALTPEERKERSKKMREKAAPIVISSEVIKRRTESIKKAWTPEKRAEAAARAREENHLKRINDWKQRRVS